MSIFRYMSGMLIILLLLNSCRKIEHLPPEPYIEFSSFEVSDTIDILGNNSKFGRLKFYFQDGDGDLGLQEPTLYSDSTNLFFTLFRRNGIEFVEADNNDPLDPSDYRIPYMVRLGQNKILKGTISVTFLYLFYSPYDTIRYEFYIKDRAKHISNTVSTCEIILGSNGICLKK